MTKPYHWRRPATTDIFPDGGQRHVSIVRDIGTVAPCITVRRSTRSAAIGAWLLLALFVATGAVAHRMPGSISTVKPGSTGDTVEIIHRIHAHDAEQGLNTVLGGRRVSLETLRGQAQLALYIEERFSLAAVIKGRPGSRLPLELIGAELDGEFILVYQEYFGELPAELAIRNDILRDVFPGQVNHVNIATGSGVRSVTFSDDDEWQRLENAR